MKVMVEIPEVHKVTVEVDVPDNATKDEICAAANAKLQTEDDLIIPSEMLRDATGATMDLGFRDDYYSRTNLPRNPKRGTIHVAGQKAGCYWPSCIEWATY